MALDGAASRVEWRVKMADGVKMAAGIKMAAYDGQMATSKVIREVRLPHCAPQGDA